MQDTIGSNKFSVYGTVNTNKTQYFLQDIKELTRSIVVIGSFSNLS